VTLAFSILFGYYIYLGICYISFTGALSCLISSFNFLISLISGLIALYIIAFISSILGILDILPISVAGITLGDDLVVEENIELPELTRNSYISFFSSSVFCRFCGIIGCSEASIFIEGVFRLGLFCLFYLFRNIFCVGVSVTNSSAKLLFSSVSSPF
jgi:hypothetical protein